MKRQDSYTISGIELTNTCAGTCIMCPRSHAMTRKQGFMDFGLFKSVITQYRADTPAGMDLPLPLDGMGESLLHPQFDRCIAYAARKGFKPTLALNPAVLTEEASRRLLNAGLYAVDLALEGADAITFGRIRGGEGWR
ncbi:radical SAM protein, partial [Desulfovibrio sp. OttesenSCG-928-I05]|nr:radical SAM protein [Desulfovibrio sp. OttesenSCG-928-I05]